MRITLPLSFPRMWINMRGASWYRYRKRRIANDVNLERILRAGYNVVDANELVNTNVDVNPFYRDYDALPELEPRFPTPPKRDRSHPDWHDQVCKIFDDTSFPVQGVFQALAFTKAVRMGDGLPNSIMDRANSIQITDEEDKMVKRIVMQAFIWDSYLEKLPKLKDPDLLWLVPKREFGIPWERSNDILIHNFARLIDAKSPVNVSLSKMMCPKEEMRVNLNRHDFPVQFKLNPLTHVMSTSPLKPILSKNEVSETAQLPLSDIFPFWSTANFEEENIYKPQDHLAVPPTSKFGNIHTSVFSHTIPGSHTHIHPRWNDDRFMGATILYNFSTALLLAKRKYGPTVSGDLPEPVTTQVIHLTGKEFQFSVFQLNTLNLEDTTPTSVKNSVWITDKLNLFTECRNYYGKEIFEGYNPDILKIVAAMYLS